MTDKPLATWCIEYTDGSLNEVEATGWVMNEDCIQFSTETEIVAVAVTHNVKIFYKVDD